MAEALIIFVRNPEWGAVKTRLAATVGNDNALLIYRQLLAHTLAVTKNLPAHKFVFYAGPIAENDLWSEAGYERLLQTEGTLGEKMCNAFQVVFSKGYSKAVIVGSDCFDLTPEIAATAFDELASHEAVIGPANDGGYYLLGMKRLYKTLFANKAWSTDGVYTATLYDFKTLGIPYFVLPELIDIDTEEDWNKVQRNRNN